MRFLLYLSQFKIQKIQKLPNMQKIDRNKDPFLYQIQFNHVKNFKSLPFAYIPLIFVTAILYLFKLYELIYSGQNPYPNMPYLTIFMIQIFCVGIVIIGGVVSLCYSGFNNIFAYMLLLSQAFGMIFVQTTMQCFQGQKWCQGQVQYQAGAILILCVYVVIIWARSLFYYPFYDNFNYVSMSSSSIVIYDFIYKLALGLITNLSFINSVQSERKFIILITIALYCVYNSSNHYCNPLINNCWLVVYTLITWTALVIYLIPYFDAISTMADAYDASTQNLFWYIWGYSTPCLIAYVVISNFSINGKNGWKTLFLQPKHQIKDLDYLYLMASQLKQKLKIARKSQLKANDSLFKTIWGLTQKHTQFCNHPQCPLAELKNIQINRNDDHLQQKRLTKTIQSCYQFCLYHLERKKDKFPNLLQLSIQIANYQLEVFQNRQKGLVLYTQYYNKENIDSNEKFTLYFLKKKIQEMFIDNDNFAKTNTENQISQFRHNIQVSVSMLAQFWYFLADPKCNLKKLYDLANILFPLKIGVDNEWKNIQKLKNIQSYNLYARYLIKMFNDKEKGLKILQQAKKIQNQLKNKQQIQVDAEGNSDIGIEQNGIIFLQFDGKNPGVMYQINLAAQKIFGYNKGQLLNRKVNDIMPKLIANHHDKILQNYQQTNKAKMMNKQRTVWGKSKDGYLFPFTILIKPVKNLMSQSSQVYASIRRQTWVKQSAFLTIDVQDQINQVSASMLGIFPQLYGKVNLKKKMHITQIIPNYAQLKQKMLQQKQSICQFQVIRQFQLNSKQKYKQATTFNLFMEQLKIQVAGHVGYLLKFQKTVIVNPQKDLALSNIKQSRLKQNLFRFIYQIQQNNQQKESSSQTTQKVLLKFKGGIVTNVQQMAKSCVNSASRFFNKIPVQEQKKIQQRKNVDYSGQIKTKRLQGKQIRQIHLISQQSQFDIGEVQKEMQQNQGTGNIKPSQLSSILQKQTSNKHIFGLKVITFGILLMSSILIIIEYVSIQRKHKNMIDSSQKIRKINQLATQILYMKMYTVQFSSNVRSDQQLQLLTNQINLLDQYLDLYSYNTQAKLVYNDESTDRMMLSFALNKLISEANSMKTKVGIYDQTNSHVQFVNYNTINGLVTAATYEKDLALDSYNGIIKSITKLQITYMSVAISIFFVIMIVKNILLRIVLKKKSQILQVFFQIPRKACTAIQKQCQKFIQKLSSQNQQDLQALSMASQGSEAGFAQQKKDHKQKKRTVMGQQKTTNNFIIATVAFLLFLIFFHVFVLIYHSLQIQILEFSMAASQVIFNVQKQASLIINLMNSYALNQKIPLLSRDLNQSMVVITQQFNKFSSIYGVIAVKFYLIGNIFDSNYLNDYNLLSYENLCTKVGKNDSQCDTFYGQNYGLNVVLSQYFNVIKDKYLQLKGYNDNDLKINSTESARLLENSRLKSQRKVQYLLKEHWRELTKVVRNGQKRLISKDDTIMFAIMLTLCIGNFTVLLFCWLKFYHSLEQKIAATQYILTFIPIDQINRNPKIANYIKQQILQKR